MKNGKTNRKPVRNAAGVLIHFEEFVAGLDLRQELVSGFYMKSKDKLFRTKGDWETALSQYVK